jgi:hypothetical protein
LIYWPSEIVDVDVVSAPEPLLLLKALVAIVGLVVYMDAALLILVPTKISNVTVDDGATPTVKTGILPLDIWKLNGAIITTKLVGDGVLCVSTIAVVSELKHPPNTIGLVTPTNDNVFPA